jgi:hypothetical protein
MRFFRNSGSPNLIVALFLIILLSMFAGPNLVPRLASQVIPGFDEGVPCGWLPTARDRGNHQSLIGRSAESPIAVYVEPGAITGDPAGLLSISIIVSNQSLGTVPFVFAPNEVIVGDNGTSGIGIIFSPSNGLVTGGSRTSDGPAYNESKIRLLAPRQSCVFRVEFPNGNILVDPSLTSGTATVRAYYRSTQAGQVYPTPGIVATPIYPNQGLWVGYVESDAVTIPLAGQ